MNREVCPQWEVVHREIHYLFYWHTIPTTVVGADSAVVSSSD